MALIITQESTKFQNLLLRYDVILSCWAMKAHQRPTFASMVSKINDLLERDSGYLKLSTSQFSKFKADCMSLESPPTCAHPIIEMEIRSAYEDEKELSVSVYGSKSSTMSSKSKSSIMSSQF